MKTRNLLALLCLIPTLYAHAQTATPDLYSWWQSSGVTGFNGIAANVQQVRYSTNYIYINSTNTAPALI